jgi:hypothetical protein
VAAGDCEGAEIDVAACVAACVNDAGNAGAACLKTFGVMADCLSDNGLDCTIVGDACYNQIEDWLDRCTVDFEATFEQIATPTTECAGSNTCIDAFDGFCDEPEGTGICADGTDTSDCCTTQCVGDDTCIDAFDGFCDEPEGTGICADATDTFDCCI